MSGRGGDDRSATFRVRQLHHVSVRGFNDPAAAIVAEAVTLDGLSVSLLASRLPQSVQRDALLREISAWAGHLLRTMCELYEAADRAQRDAG